MRAGAIALVVALGAAGCGGGSDDRQGSARATTEVTTGADAGPGPAGKLPPGAVPPEGSHDEQADEGPAANEASPEASAAGPESTGDLPSEDRAAVTAAVRSYISAIDRHDAARLCALLVPGSLDPADLPKPGRGCRRSLAGSIGTPPRSGGPAWRRTSLVEVSAEDLGNDRARVSATVTHRFSDRKYVSVEDDVIYLERNRSRWLIAKPSGTLYRAVGYREPPLRSLSPPAGW